MVLLKIKEAMGMDTDSEKEETAAMKNKVNIIKYYSFMLDCVGSCFGLESSRVIKTFATSCVVC